MRLAGVWLGAMLALASTVLAPCAARAQPFQGIYIGAGAGYNVPQNIQLDIPEPASQRRYLVSHNGFATLGSIGYGLGNGFRFELEGNYRQDGFARISGGSLANSGSGKIQTYGGMANVLFDMDIGFPWIYPYVGGGAGYAETRFNDIALTTPSGRGVATQGSLKAGGFAFQAIAGLSFPVPHVPGLSLTTEYRFMGIPGSETVSSSDSSGSLKIDRQVGS